MCHGRRDRVRDWGHLKCAQSRHNSGKALTHFADDVFGCCGQRTWPAPLHSSFELRGDWSTKPNPRLNYAAQGIVAELEKSPEHRNDDSWPVRVQQFFSW